ncbi:MAG: sigma 54-interacting transcriptional regulator [Duncaniella sp.]|jgi:transcriptional regulator with PAS, ATPase and Fis domain|uniref:sigma-54 interaction domain-containing protein n=1 Tax=Duncaniella muricolitica TaxID=2880704 RepID=UPI0023CCC1F6|nr:sigma 54-interacting transcriptional regulator [Duncaniella muricolitica]MCX4369303.1 sigma 54-interacting transcriptional regulator [Duncaniella sp.]MDE5927513.1 sigma 54-interacting transcriptional regulator [Duncaniella sp.]
MELQRLDYPPQVERARQRFGIVGNSPALMESIARAVQVAPIDLSVLVTGESGTGKEFFPKIIHEFSPRKHSRYIAVNCGAIPEGTIDSELFGHEKGAFTGAVATRKGYFEEADGGTIFLDEVAELPLTTQARLLRVLESGEFIKVGSSTVQRANVRIVAATNVDMARAVAEGRFREDLYYRLSTVSISIPPLRDRGGDILLLSRKFAADFAERYTMPRISFDDTARQLLMAYRWPGNVRQLKNVVEQMALFHAGETVDSSLLRPYLPGHGAGLATIPGSRSDQPHDYAVEREMLLGMVMRLQQQIDSLSERLDRMSQHSDARFVDTFEPESAQMSSAPTRSIVKFEPFCSPLSAPSPVSERRSDTYEDVSPATLEDTERETIRRALERNGGRRKATAAELNISERTLYRKIKEYGME